MATKNFVPRADLEGGIGTESKKWASGSFGRVNVSSYVSGSGASTASFGTYIGDGSQLTGIGISGSAIDALNITASGISMSQGEIVGGTASLAHLNMISGNAFFNQVAIGTSPDPTASYGFHLFSETL